MGPASGLQVVDLHKSFEGKQALAGVSFELPEGELLGVLGPSGCGKSTLLNLIAGLDVPDQGEVLWDGADLASTPPHKRLFGLMFQDFSLFPHMNVFDNVAFGLQMAHLPAADIQTRVDEILELVGLPGFAQRDVNTLSGGEQQRVALARALAPHPRLLMLDEPLGSLDRNLRERLVYDLRPILHGMQQTAIYVTHDQEEAFILADQVLLLNAGRVEQSGSPQGIYCCPASLFVAQFLGLNNLLAGEIVQRNGVTFAQTGLGTWPVQAGRSGSATILLRPDAIRLAGPAGAHLQGRLKEVSFKGRTSRAVVTVQDSELSFDFPSNTRLPALGEEIALWFEPEEALQMFY